MADQYVATDKRTGFEVAVTGKFPEHPDDRMRIARTTTLFTRLMSTLLQKEETARRLGFRAIETQLELADALIRQDHTEVQRLVRETLTSMGVGEDQLRELAERLRDAGGLDPAVAQELGRAFGLDMDEAMPRKQSDEAQELTLDPQVVAGIEEALDAAGVDQADEASTDADPDAERAGGDHSDQKLSRSFLAVFDEQIPKPLSSAFTELLMGTFLETFRGAFIAACVPLQDQAVEAVIDETADVATGQARSTVDSKPLGDLLSRELPNALDNALDTAIARSVSSARTDEHNVQIDHALTTALEQAVSLPLYDLSGGDKRDLLEFFNTAFDLCYHEAIGGGFRMTFNSVFVDSYRAGFLEAAVSALDGLRAVVGDDRRGALDDALGGASFELSGDALKAAVAVALRPAFDAGRKRAFDDSFAKPRMGSFADAIVDELEQARIRNVGRVLSAIRAEPKRRSYGPDAESD